ncbi:MAG: tRNA preQ1(34) S-adenosylmethionine ribosyltransferase-isomerase QueA [Candidatus Dormibacteraeota bacterium]|nr:tRNA preQ1(34) S-adenosylmethionine ribosyltransferase-isomerase QueA [Candidatus Dormibacteraeota bacterium]
MRTESFDYPLSPERIAQTPLPERDASRLLQVHPDGGVTDHWFTDLPGLLRSGDLLVANETRVRHARLHGTDAAGRNVELLLLEHLGGDDYTCLARPGRRASPGAELQFEGGLSAAVLAGAGTHPGERTVRLRIAGGDVERAVEAAGTAPVPPYIREVQGDPGRYQTVYAAGDPSSAAAPTAGLHFTDAVLSALRAHGIGWTTVRLDVGLGTFAPMRGEAVDDHVMHREHYDVSEAAAAAIEHTRARGGRVVAVGTTVVRVLESCAGDDGIRAGTGSTGLFIRPGFRFRAVDALVTNFHQPRSTLLVLLAAFIGDAWREAYAHALQSGYRFLSFGDCMLCWPRR